MALLRHLRWKFARGCHAGHRFEGEHTMQQGLPMTDWAIVQGLMSLFDIAEQDALILVAWMQSEEGTTWVEQRLLVLSGTVGGGETAP